MLLRVGAFVALLCWSFSALAAETRTVTDRAGRQVPIPIHIEGVFAAGPPAAAQG